MRVRTAVLVFLFAVSLGAPRASAAPSPLYPAGWTTMSVTAQQADGSPLPNAQVTVYYGPFDPPGVQFSPQVMASGTSDASGLFAGRLDDTMVQLSELGDTGDSESGNPDRFNALIVATGSDGHFGVQQQIAKYAGETATTVIASETGAPGATGLTVTPIGYGYRYMQVLAWNNAYGLKSTFTYSFSSSEHRELNAQVAIQYSGKPWSVGGYLLEEAKRTTTAAPFQTIGYHKYYWANYYWVEYQIESCSPTVPPVCNIWSEWHANAWQGTISDNNPNKNASGVTIGIRPYYVPPFDTNPNHWVVMYANSGPWARGLGQVQAYGFNLSLAGFIGLYDKATYAKETWIQYEYKDGCGQSRVIWGNGTFPADQSLGIVQASCVTLP